MRDRKRKRDRDRDSQVYPSPGSSNCISHMSTWFSSALLPPLSPIYISFRNQRQAGIRVSKNTIFKSPSPGYLPSTFLSALFKALLGSIHLLYKKIRCCGDCFLSKHHWHYTKSSTLILLRQVPTIAYPNLSYRYLITKFLLPLNIKGFRVFYLYFSWTLFLIYYRDI